MMNEAINNKNFLNWMDEQHYDMLQNPNENPEWMRKVNGYTIRVTPYEENFWVLTEDKEGNTRSDLSSMVYTEDLTEFLLDLEDVIVEL